MTGEKAGSFVPTEHVDDEGGGIRGRGVSWML